jgi:hypothetical protein
VKEHKSVDKPMPKDIPVSHDSIRRMISQIKSNRCPSHQTTPPFSYPLAQLFINLEFDPIVTEHFRFFLRVEGYERRMGNTVVSVSGFPGCPLARFGLGKRVKTRVG